MSNKLVATKSELFPVLEDFFKPWSDLFSNGGSRSLTSPATNITENKDEYKVSIAAPGLKKSDFKIDVERNTLTVSSEKEESQEEKNDRYTRKEFSYSSFSRSFFLPEEINQEKIAANYENGVLKLVLPKKEESKKISVSKHIAVN